MFGVDKRDTGLRIGDEGSAARYFYTAKPSRREKEAGLDAFPRDEHGRIEGMHPTIKPVELLRWLVRLLSRPGQLVLDPFAGSGTTAIACALEGRRWVAVERDPDYARIAAARIAWWEREARRKPGRSVAEVLGEGPRTAAAVEGQGALL